MPARSSGQSMVAYQATSPKLRRGPGCSWKHCESPVIVWPLREIVPSYLHLPLPQPTCPVRSIEIWSPLTVKLSTPAVWPPSIADQRASKISVIPPPIIADERNLERRFRRRLGTPPERILEELPSFPSGAEHRFCGGHVKPELLGAGCIVAFSKSCRLNYLVL